MKIKKIVLEKINNPQTRTRIAMKLGVGEQGIAVQLRRNNPDGRMTKMDALQVISEESGFGIEEILEQEPITAEATK